jgi:hypothetical protein
MVLYEGKKEMKFKKSDYERYKLLNGSFMELYVIKMYILSI